jgi:ABC-type glycerol-3-phosphate transport system substrate-binding protein
MNQKQKKLLIILGSILVILILVLVGILFAGGSDNNNPTGNNNQDDNNNVPEGGIELSYWGLWEPESVMDPIIQEFESENPGVNIAYTQYSFTNYENIAYRTRS